MYFQMYLITEIHIFANQSFKNFISTLFALSNPPKTQHFSKINPA